MDGLDLGFSLLEAVLRRELAVSKLLKVIDSLCPAYIAAKDNGISAFQWAWASGLITNEELDMAYIVLG